MTHDGVENNSTCDGRHILSSGDYDETDNVKEKGDRKGLCSAEDVGELGDWKFSYSYDNLLNDR